jgi:hypothetical protein
MLSAPRNMSRIERLLPLRTVRTLDFGSDQTRMSLIGATALHLGSQNGHFLIVETLIIQSGAEIDC